jgi:acyl carrier protein
MSTQNIIRGFVAARLEVPVETIDLGADLRSLGEFNSIRALQIVLDVEEHFDIEVEDDVVFGIHTVREFAQKIDDIVAAADDSVNS